MFSDMWHTRISIYYRQQAQPPHRQNLGKKPSRYSVLILSLCQPRSIDGRRCSFSPTNFTPAMPHQPSICGVPNSKVSLPAPGRRDAV